MKSNPYESPQTTSDGSSRQKRSWGCLKHFSLYLALLFVANFNRFFGTPSEAADAPKISITGSVLGILMFYGIGYMIFARARSRK
jgi:uncharacterized Tic20 family protein